MTLVGPLGTIIGLLLSAYFAGSELAFTSLNTLYVLMWKHQRKAGSGRTLVYHRDPDNFLITMLVGNNLANTLTTSFATLWLLGAGWPEWAVFPLVAVGVLLVGEVAAKQLGHRYAHQLFPRFSSGARFFELLFLPAVCFLRLISLVLRRLFGGMDRRVGEGLRSQLGYVFNDAGRTGLIEHAASTLLDRALGLRDKTVHDLMTPRTQVAALAIDDPVSRLTELTLATGFSKFPVFRGDLDRIVGYVTARDVFRKPATLRDVIRPIYHFPELMSARNLLAVFGRHNLNLAVVLDEYGGTAGIVTMEDLLEELVGDIVDEHDRQPLRPAERRGERVLVDAAMRVDHFVQAVGCAEPDTEADTLAGWLLETLGRIPKRGEQGTLGGLEVSVADADSRRVHSLLIRPPAHVDASRLCSFLRGEDCPLGEA